MTKFIYRGEGTGFANPLHPLTPAEREARIEAKRADLYTQYPYGDCTLTDVPDEETAIAQQRAVENAMVEFEATLDDERLCYVTPYGVRCDLDAQTDVPDELVEKFEADPRFEKVAP